MKGSHRFFVLTALLGSLATGWAGPRDLLVFSPGAPGSAEDAATVMSQFGAAIAKGAGWPTDAIKVSYENDLQAGLNLIDQNKPGFALVSLPVYLAHGTKLKMKLVAQTVPADNKADRYYIMGLKDGPANLAAAKGLKLASNLLYDKTFISRVVLGGQDVEQFFSLKEVSSGLRAIKLVAGEEKKADLVLLDQHQFNALGGAPGGNKLKVVHQSPELPTAPVVAFEGVAAEADIAAVKKALLGLAADPSAKELLETMTLKGFTEPDAAAYAAARKLYAP
jgi:ABC transporter, phosphonate, periplasmic substrate-binding protein